MTLINFTSKNTTPIWKIVRKDNEFLELTNEFELKEKGFRYRYKSEDKARQDGSVIIGDGSQEDQIIELVFKAFTKESDIVKYRDTINTIEAFFRDDQKPYYLQDVILQKEKEIVRSKHDIKPPVGNRNITSDNVLTFFAPNPKWNDIAIVEDDTNTGLTNGATFSINNESKFDSFLVIEFTAVDQVVSFTLENLTMDAGFSYGSNDFINGAILTADSITGLVTQGGLDRSSQFTEGGLLRLLPGINNFELETLGTMDIKFSWKIRNVI